jgi:hypothetical protein
MRVVNRVASILLGILLIVGGLLAAAEAIAANRGQRPLFLRLRQWYDRLAETTFADRTVRQPPTGCAPASHRCGSRTPHQRC